MRRRLRHRVERRQVINLGQGAAYGINDAWQASGFLNRRSLQRPKSTHLGCKGLVLSSVLKFAKITARARLFAKINATGAMCARRAGNKAQIPHIDANREQADTLRGRFSPIRRTKP
jgi:hypothetical protein